MPDGEYQLGGQLVVVQNGTAAFADGTLAGSVLTMNRAFLNAMRFADLTPHIASGFASANAGPAAGLIGSSGKHSPGLNADLAILNPTNG